MDSMYKVLEMAVSDGQTKLVSYLFSQGIKPKQNSYLMHKAVRSKNQEMITLLAPYCDLNIKDDKGKTPLMLCSNKDLAALLFKLGAKLEPVEDEYRLSYKTLTNLANINSNKNNEKEQDSEVFTKNNNTKNLNNVTKSRRSELTEPFYDRFFEHKLSFNMIKPNYKKDKNGRDIFDFGIETDEGIFTLSRRFMMSLGRVLKFSPDIFKVFTPEEVFARISKKEPDFVFNVIEDRENHTLLGAYEANKKILYPNVSLDVLTRQKNLSDLNYNGDGTLEAIISLDDNLSVLNDSAYDKFIELHLPVDGVATPSIYLKLQRQVCSNGATMLVNSLRSEIILSDNSGDHLQRLLNSYNNESGFEKYVQRLHTANKTPASLDEVLKVENLMTACCGSKENVFSLNNIIEELAGNPRRVYGVTSLKNIPKKTRQNNKTRCNIADLFNLSTELMTHHKGVLSEMQRFKVQLSRFMAHPFDFEEIEERKCAPKAFYLNDFEEFEGVNDNEFLTDDYFDYDDSYDDDIITNDIFNLGRRGRL